MAVLLDDVISRLELAGVVGGSTGWTPFRAFVPPSPDQVIVVTETGGAEPDQTDGDKYEEVTFQVRVRGKPMDYASARAKAREVYLTLNNASLGTDYVYCYATTAAPLPLGYDDNDRPELTWNFRTLVRRT